MLTEIIRKEMLEHLISLRFAITCVLCFVVILCSLFVRVQDYNLALDDYNQNSAQANTQLRETHRPWSFAWRGMTAFQAPNPLKVFVRGVENENGMAVHMNAFEPVQFLGTFIPNAIIPLFSAMDLINFVGIIMSLLAIVFGYDAICGEKERGTLRLMLSYSVPRDKVLVGKWVGGFVALILPFVLTVVAGIAIVLVQPKVEIREAQWLKFGGVCVLALFYIACIYSLALWVSCLTARPSTSIMILVTIWLLLILTVPNLSPYIAQSLQPTRNPIELETMRMTKNREIWKRQIDDKNAAINKKLGFKTDNWWEELDWNKLEDWRRGIQRWTAEAECNQNANLERMAACRKIDEDFERDLDNQIALSRWIARISPFSCFAMSATELTDAGLLNKRRFIKQVRDFQGVFTRYAMTEWLKYEAVLLKEGGPNIKSPDWSQMRGRIPTFAYTPPAGTEYLHTIILDAGLLVAATFLFFMLSFLAFIRYDVR